MEIDPKYSLFYPDEQGLKQRRYNGLRETHLSREAAIKSGPVAVISLAGQNADMVEYINDNRICWTFEPVPDLEKIVKADVVTSINSFEAGMRGRTKVWEFLVETAEKMSRKTGVPVQPDFLTPYQAVILIAEAIAENMDFEPLITDSDLTERIKAGKITKTKRPDLLSLYLQDPEKFKEEKIKLGGEYDNMTADEIIETGLGVCRHIAGVVALMYEVLKERQLGVLLNGTYLTYHDEKEKGQRHKSVVGFHAYNLLVVTSPTGETTFSVIDPTWMINNGEVDYTWKRISQVCLFLNNYGNIFYGDKAEEISENLAMESLRRMVKYFDKYKLPLYDEGNGFCVMDFLSDYVSLTDQSIIGKNGGTLQHLVDFLGRYGLDREEALCEVMDLPAYKIQYADNTIGLYQARYKEVNQELDQVDFRGGFDDAKSIITEFLEGTIGGLGTNVFKNLNKFNSKINDPDREMLILIGHFVRACVQLTYLPEGKRLFLVIEEAIKVAKRHKVHGHLLTFEKQYLDLLKAKR